MTFLVMRATTFYPNVYTPSLAELTKKYRQFLSVIIITLPDLQVVDRIKHTHTHTHTHIYIYIYIYGKPIGVQQLCCES
jgi:hypothetical protein